MRHFFIIVMTLFTQSVFAQTFIETFDANSFNWTECTFDNKENSKAYIEHGHLVISSDEGSNFWSMCYAPIDIKKPFKIKAFLTYSDDEGFFSMLFNLKDNGTYYALTFNEEQKKVYFRRYIDDKYVGGWVQGFPYPKLRKGENLEISIESDCQTLNCEVQGIPLFNLRYIDIKYQGFGFMTYGDQEIRVDQVEFYEY